MGKIYSPLAGNIVGRVGATVYRKGQSATVAAQYQPQVANPRSRAQSITRAAFSTAAAGQAALAFLVNHSFEGKNGKRANLQRFMQLNSRAISEDIKSVLFGSKEEIEGSLNIKSVPYIQNYPFIVSAGSLPVFAISELGPVENVQIAGKFLLTPWVDSLQYGSYDDSFASQTDYEAILASLGLRPGDELSVVAVVSSNEMAATFETSQGLAANEVCHVEAARVTFKPALPASFDAPLIVNGAFNPDLLERVEGTMYVVPETKEGKMRLGLCVGDPEGVSSAAAIRSALDNNGKYLYSPAKMLNDGEGFETSAYIVESYEAAAAGGNGSKFFLDNPARG